jgi:hypothetical protein
LDVLCREYLIGVVVAGDQQVMACPQVILRPVFAVDCEGLFDHDRNSGGDDVFQPLQGAAYAEFGIQPAGVIVHVVRDLFHVHVAVVFFGLDDLGNVVLIAVPAVIAQVKRQCSGAAVVDVFFVAQLIVGRRVQQHDSRYGGGSQRGSGRVDRCGR